MCIEKPLNEILRQDFIETYKLEVKVIWDQIVVLNSYLYILKTILKFPLSLFKPLKLLFWRLVVRSLYESSILICFKLIFDTDSKSLTISKLKNKIISNLVDDSIKSEVIQNLKQIDFSKKNEELGRRINKIRNKFVAHIDRDWNTIVEKESLNDIVLNFNELFELSESIDELFEILCFNEQRLTHYPEYAPSSKVKYQTRQETDIEEILLLLVKNSNLLNMPESQPAFWPIYKKTNLSLDDLELLNQYRNRFGLPDA